MLCRGLEKRAVGRLLVCGDILPLIQKVSAVLKQQLESRVLNRGLNRGLPSPALRCETSAGRGLRSLTEKV